MLKNYSFYILLIVISISACQSKKTASQEEIIQEATATISQSDFGTVDDQAVFLYTLTNTEGIEMKVTNYGGIITALSIPDREGKFEDVVLGYDSLQGYLDSSPYFGALIGRYGNRIAGGKFTLDNVEYSLETNNGQNALHGGVQGFDKRVWNAEGYTTTDGAGLKMTRLSPDGEEGYPGNLSCEVTYFLGNDNTLTFEYKATTDKKTIVNLTNHAYYNFTGMNEDILGHELVIKADKYLPVDQTLIPLGIEPVTDTPFDFTTGKTIGQNISDKHDQIAAGGGYDHCWAINETEEELAFAASLYEPKSGRFMEIFTSEPGIQFYSGNFLNGTITGKNDIQYSHRMGLCLETQHHPDSPNQPDFQSVVLSPGEEYFSVTKTKFSVK